MLGKELHELMHSRIAEDIVLSAVDEECAGKDAQQQQAEVAVSF